MPMHLHIMASSRAECRISLESSFDSITNPNSCFAVSWEFLVGFHIIQNIVIKPLTFSIEIWMVQVKENLAVIYSSFGDRITPVLRIKDWTAVRLKRQKFAIVLIARIQYYRLFNPKFVSPSSSLT